MYILLLYSNILYTVSKKVLHQTRGNNFVNS